MNNALRTMYIVQSTLYSVQKIVQCTCIKHWASNIVQRTIYITYTVTVYDVWYTLYSVHRILYVVQVVRRTI